jgi:heme/copper-type cytochrome/quinol oxidase subunit 2
MTEIEWFLMLAFIFILGFLYVVVIGFFIYCIHKYESKEEEKP